MLGKRSSAGGPRRVARACRALLLVVLSACGSVRGNEKTPCREWHDVEAGLHFPPAVAGLSMTDRTVYGDDDYSVSYESPERGERKPGQSMLTCYVYSREGATVAEGVGPEVRKEMEDVVATVRGRPDFTNVVVGASLEGRLPGSGQAYLLANFTYGIPGLDAVCAGSAFVTGFRGKFLKLRYTGPLEAKDGGTQPRFKTVLADLDARLRETIEARKVDVYAIGDPVARLAALRRKWAGAESRVGMWNLPDYRERFQRLDAQQRWCSENIDERVEAFAEVARAGIALRIEPPVWYYNLACALARQKKVGPALEALEKSVAAGYYDREHAESDADLGNMREDRRFGLLLASMAAIPEPFYNGPQEPACVRDGIVRLSERNVYYALGDNAFTCQVKGLSATNGAVALLVGDARLADGVPGLVPMVFPEEAWKKTVGRYQPDVLALDGDMPLPVFFANADDCREEGLPDGELTGIPGRLALGGGDVADVLSAGLGGCLGILSCSDDYKVGGQDRLMGYAPVGLFYEGDDAAPFVRAAMEAYRALPDSTRIKALEKSVLPDLLLTILLDGKWRPCLTRGDLDLDAIRARASKAVTPPPFRPAFKHVETVGAFTPTSDLWGSPWNHPYVAGCAIYSAFSAYNAERKFVLQVQVAKASAPGTRRLVWKVLQGPENGVRVIPAPDGQEARLEIDRPAAPFTVALPNGGTVASLRVDIACFAECDGVLSAPSVVSVAFSPNETRTYDGKGRLASIDYTKPQFGDWRARRFVRGNWKDTYHYTEDDVLTGWTRTCAETGTTNEFTREGLVVVTRDAQGRPKDVRRDLNAEWMQDFGTWVTTGLVFRAQKMKISNGQERREASPLENTLAWQYAYADDGDRLGEPSPKPPHSFDSEPRDNARADFGASGFEIPLLSRMSSLYEGRYMAFKYGAEQNAEELMRPDGEVALRAKGLVPPKVLAKMSFCAQVAEESGWSVSPEEFEAAVREQLTVQSDGGCRFKSPDKEARWFSMRDTYQLVNAAAENVAFDLLDSAYERCSREVVRAVFRHLLDEQAWKTCRVLTGTESPSSGMDGDGDSDPTFAAWRISERLYFAIHNGLENGFRWRTYVFARTPGNEASEYVSLDFVDEVPSPAIGNAVLRADRGDAAALNNLAVLNYAGIVNHGRYDEKTVKTLLMRSAEQGNATAMRNLAILYENRGEPGKGTRFREAARLREQELSVR